MVYKLGIQVVEEFMTELMSINAVAARLTLSVHQLRRWELMFGLEIKRGRGQQRQYRAEDLSVLERIKELVDQGWPTSQIRPQLEAEGLVSPKLIGLPTPCLLYTSQQGQRLTNRPQIASVRFRSIGR